MAITITDKQRDEMHDAVVLAARSMSAWLAQGGDARLRDFTPLAQWVDLLAALRPIMRDRRPALRLVRPANDAQEG
jgi:hypothetical protein